MASVGNSHSPSINRSNSDVSPTVTYNESRIPIPASPTNMVKASNSISSVPFIRSSKKKRTAVNDLELRRVSPDKQEPIENTPTVNMGYRLGSRRALTIRLGIISDMMCLFGLLGVILMIIENEITFTRINHKGTKISWFLKLIITMTTIILVTLVFYYHRLQLQLYSIRNSLDNWILGLTTTKIISIAVEVIICAIHPIPQFFPQNSNSTIIDSCTITPVPLSCIAIDVALGLPMFARLYLPCRCLMFHSHYFRDVSSRSLGCLNQVSIDYFFLIKAYFQQWPTRSLITFWTIVFFIGSWSLRACDYTSTNDHMSLLDAMWLFIVTFTTVGYGDLVPTTYCGRTVVTLISIIGLLTSALLITVWAQKLEFSRSEKYVYNFVLNTELAKEHEHQAANVIKYAVKLWYMKKQGKDTPIQRYQRLYGSILSVQKNEQERRKLIDNCVDMVDSITMQRQTTTKTDKTAQQIRTMTAKVDKIEANLIDINHAMGSLHNTLNAIDLLY